MIGMDWGKISVTTLDEQFLMKITRVISDHLQDIDLNVGMLQEEMALSREHLYRKLKALIGDSPSDLIRKMRLMTAASMIEKGERNITEIALNTGFSSSSSFAQRFKKHFGMTPSDYARKFNKLRTRN